MGGNQDPFVGERIQPAVGVLVKFQSGALTGSGRQPEVLRRLGLVRSLERVLASSVPGES